MKHYRKIFFLLLFWERALSALSYTASIEGVDDKILEESMRHASTICSSSNKTAVTPISLKLRVTGDVDRLKNTAQNAGFFNCTIKPFVTFAANGDATVIFQVTLGSQFSLGNLDIVWSDEDIVRSLFAPHSEWLEKRVPTLSCIPSYKKGVPAVGKRLLALSDELRSSLRSKGYAFCKIVDTEWLAHRNEKSVDVRITVQTGPITRFGTPVFIGAPNIDPKAFQSHLQWKYGDFYSPKQIEKTESSLQQTGLFQSIQIDAAEEISYDWTIPMLIRVSEAKARTVSAGISYTTTYGAGLSCGWEHRNINGMGRKLSTQIQIWEKMRSATLSYTIPNFARDEQNLIWILEYDQQHYLPFESSMASASLLFDRQLTRHTDGVAGLSIERLASHGIIRSELFHLLKVPLQIRWSSANSALDPTKGVSVSCKLTPSFQLLLPTFSYYIHSSSIAAYHSLFHDKITFAARAQIGNIVGSSRRSIPLPDRLFAGSENSLRGYKTGSVSPLNHNGQPIGGRSMLTGTFEARFRSNNRMGWVAFYDCGQVFGQPVPSFRDSLLFHSVGIGLRFQTPIGPLRLDFAVPLQRRKTIDPAFQIYFSIGQAF